MRKLLFFLPSLPCLYDRCLQSPWLFRLLFFPAVLLPCFRYPYYLPRSALVLQVRFRLPQLPDGLFLTDLHRLSLPRPLSCCYPLRIRYRCCYRSFWILYLHLHPAELHTGLITQIPDVLPVCPLLPAAAFLTLHISGLLEYKDWRQCFCKKTKTRPFWLS